MGHQRWRHESLLGLRYRRAIAALRVHPDVMRTTSHGSPSFRSCTPLLDSSHGVVIEKMTFDQQRWLSLPVYLPPLREQQRIAEILDNIDEAIHSTESLIAKLERMKQGLLHDVLSRGINDNGELRDASGQPEQFQETSIGLLPRSWKLETAGREFDVRSGITLGPEREPGKNSEYLRVANVYRGRLVLDDVARLQASAAERYEYALRVGRPSNVEGHANPYEIGRCAIVTERAKNLLYQNHLFRLRAKTMVPEFSELWLNSETMQSYWHRVCSSSSGLNTINSKQLKAAPVAIPQRHEQEVIVQMVKSASRETAAAEATLDKLQTLKAGLADDLLTGRVRVTVDDLSAS